MLETTFGFSRIGSTEMMFPQTTETQLLLTYARDGKHFSSLKAIYGQTGSGNMAAVYFLFHQIQCIGLSATVSTLQTTSGLVETGSTEIRRWSIPKQWRIQGVGHGAMALPNHHR